MMTLGERMKRYEKTSDFYVMQRCPTIIRIDGKKFSKWTKTLKKPFDDNLVLWMARTMKHIVDNTQNAVFAYCQSDEISIFLNDYKNIETEQSFSGRVQKMCSVTSSMATAIFNDMVSNSGEPYDSMPLAYFDARVFNVPVDDVTNYFIWRQEDCSKNSVQSLARFTLGHNECQGLSLDELKNKMLENVDVNWLTLPQHLKFGCAYSNDSKDVMFTIPEFKHLREFVDKHVYNVT
jgi:tRNA(His) 5'-end guanylyltransferase